MVLQEEDSDRDIRTWQVKVSWNGVGFLRYDFDWIETLLDYIAELLPVWRSKDFGTLSLKAALPQDQGGPYQRMEKNKKEPQAVSQGLNCCCLSIREWQVSHIVYATAVKVANRLVLLRPRLSLCEIHPSIWQLKKPSAYPDGITP